MRNNIDEKRSTARHYGENPSSSTHWIRIFQPRPEAKLRLFCFPYAGGGPSAYRTWADSLPDSIEVCSPLLPGRETRLREKPLTQFTPLIEELGTAILPLLDRPFAFFGHSMGAMVGFELARFLRRRDAVQPRYLLVSSTSAPQTHDGSGTLHLLPDEEFMRILQLYGGTPPGILEDAELRAFFLPLVRADFAAYESYIYTPDEPLLCPILAFGGSKDKTVSQPELLAWKAQTSTHFSSRFFPGDHFYLNTYKHQLLQHISDVLNTVI